MEQKNISFNVEVYSDQQTLAADDFSLLKMAKEATAGAYAPYSSFRVAAAARLANGKILTGTNQENASYPAGICAERVLLSVAASVYPGIPIDSLAISYHNQHGASESPISPCGICRQSLVEYEQRIGHPMRLILGGNSGPVYIVGSAASLLPLAFTSAAMG